ncbi:MAG: hypothetical protein E6J29_05640 [Chloroflexi bacterium]|nr:MAG: hypothetical protein E6J29_05640 [Chloroflexota bacterium]
MSGPQPPRRLHRAVVLVLLIVGGLLWLALTIPNPSRVGPQSWVALGVVLLVAAAGGIAFSWGRYFRRR